MDVTTFDGGRIVTLSQFLSPNECETWIGRAERMGFHHALIGVSGGDSPREAVPQSLTELDADSLTLGLFERARPSLPATWQARGLDWELLGFHPRLRFYRYDPSDHIPVHQDDPVLVAEDTQSWLTMLVFLNECTGGSIRFHRDQHGLGGPAAQVHPSLGMAAFFPHNTWHDAADVATGRKYLLRADVLYRAGPR